MIRGPYKKVAIGNAKIQEIIAKLKSDHPFWGYRRIWAHLNYVDRVLVNKKRVYNIMKHNNLLVRSNTRLIARRSKVETKKPIPCVLNQWWGIDMTKTMIPSCGYVYITIVLDWYSKKVVGYHLGLRSRASDWLCALDMALNKELPSGAREYGLNLMCDNGSQPTSSVFMKACSKLWIKQSFTSYNNPKGNADTERFMRTLKEELLWIKEFSSFLELKLEFETWINFYNNNYLHSSLGYMPPAVFADKPKNNTLTLT